MEVDYYMHGEHGGFGTRNRINSWGLPIGLFTNGLNFNPVDKHA